MAPGRRGVTPADALAEKAAAALEPLRGRFADQTALIFASGPSLTKLWSKDRQILFPSIAVNDSWKIAPKADVLYSTDARWWRHHNGAAGFGGVRVGYDNREPCPAGIICLQGSGRTGYDPRLGWVRHGLSSGYVAVHLAAQLGASRIVLVGFDCRPVNGKEHWFGSHPPRVKSAMPYDAWAENFAGLAKELAARDVEVLNATPGSALKCFPMVDLKEVDVWQMIRHSS